VVDRARILALIDVVEQHVRHVETLTPRVFDAYAGDTRTRLAVERALQVAIEAIVDAAALVAAGKRIGLPADEETVAGGLQRAGCLDEGEAKLLGELRRFRNVLVHQYGVLDDRRVHLHALDAPDALRRLTVALRRCL
jgi:uncharacterized protein YutE (UPF0331/DUF86 family)